MDGRLLALASAILFGSSPVILALGLRDASANRAVLVSLLVGLPFLLVVSPLLGGLHFNQLTLRAVAFFAAGGLLGPLIGRLFLYNAIDRLGSARAFTIKNSSPLVAAMAAILLLSEPVTLLRWLAIVLIVTGMAIVGKQSDTLRDRFRFSGLVLAILAAMSFGMRPIVFKLGFQEKTDPMTASVVGVTAAIVGVFVYLLLSGQLRSVRPRLERRSMALFIVVGLTNNAGFLVLNHALNAEDVTLVYPINSAAPLLTFGMSALILKNIEKLSLWDFVGTLSVVAGVILLIL